MQDTDIRGSIAFQQIGAIVIAKLIHLYNALIVQLDI